MRSFYFHILLSMLSPLVVGGVESAIAINLAQGEDSILVPLKDRFGQANATSNEIPNFQRHVVALFGRLGCNGRSCHGSFQGQGGFRLSMFGYDFDQDHRSLLEEGKQRVNLSDPNLSLILRKPTSDEDHEGGKRFDIDGWETRVLRAWIESGAKDDSHEAGKLKGIDVTPEDILFNQAGESIPLRVIAHWDDGTREDVTCLCRFSSKNDDVASVTDDGIVTAKSKGDAHVIVTYDNAVESVTIIAPNSDFLARGYPEIKTASTVDRLVIDQLRVRGIIPSVVCTDEEFLRRVYLDIIGCLPTPNEVTSFLADSNPEKRNKKIDELLAHPAYALWWSTKFCDFTGLNGPLQLGTTDFGLIMTEHWRSWLERKIRDNVSYDKLVEGMVVAVSRRPGQSYKDYASQMSSYTLTKNPVDFTERETMPNYWFRGNLGTADDKALAFSYAFMGVRLDCAQCHKHPFDRWSQKDFKQFAAIFERVRWGISPECKEVYDALRKELGVPEKLSTAATRRQSYSRWAKEGKIVPWPEVFIASEEDLDSGAGADKRRKKENDEELTAKLLGDKEIDVRQVDDPRRPLMDWLRRSDNPYFAKALVNRFWAHYFGRGIVEPVDDLSLANPPTNPQLFEYLAQGFVENGFDMKWLHREITRSETYQRSWRANDTNINDDRQFSHAAIRRLPAEVAVDAMQIATSKESLAESFAAKLVGRRIGVQAAADLARTEFALAVFGKPLRTINCDCEREQSPSLAQSIFVRNDQDLHAMLQRSDGWINELSKRKDLDDPEVQKELIRTAYLRVLSRQPRDWESTRASQQISTSEQIHEGIHDLMWALLNTQEFITNH